MAKLFEVSYQRVSERNKYKDPANVPNRTVVVEAKSKTEAADVAREVPGRHVLSVAYLKPIKPIEYVGSQILKLNPEDVASIISSDNQLNRDVVAINERLASRKGRKPLARLVTQDVVETPAGELKHVEFELPGTSVLDERLSSIKGRLPSQKQAVLATEALFPDPNDELEPREAILKLADEIEDTQFDDPFGKVTEELLGSADTEDTPEPSEPLTLIQDLKWTPVRHSPWPAAETSEDEQDPEPDPEEEVPTFSPVHKALLHVGFVLLGGLIGYLVTGKLIASALGALIGVIPAAFTYTGRE